MKHYPGVILAGGEARRMGGTAETKVDKAMVKLGGAPLIERVISRLEPQCATLAISANGDPKRYAAFGYPILPDATPEQNGPLAGVLAGLDWAAMKGFEAIVTVATDTPFFPKDLVTRLGAVAQPEGFGIAVTEEAGETRWHPTFGLWPVDLRHDLRIALARHQRRMLQFAESKGAVPVLFETAEGEDPFFNVNTPDDLQQAEAQLA
ncbi:molybdenum cofactor guanylyltransferase MobA [Celeribacter neptunius]|uniref:Molybdenum cofactor guanylyltransferase n=1 Tax=Celeribacter neptunius TaxID=588602 RepID=A0A1I3QZI0_9RHOB|nr:molybdenum cofactor guanylyltransferase MobA [Celeribacter neptunius]SFJ38486.1 molybdopterin-guanine dinucleotide biosynthesis protein A [Celeribacter neptunius]